MIGLIEVTSDTFAIKIRKMIDCADMHYTPLYSKQLRAMLFALGRGSVVQVDIEFYYQVHREYDDVCRLEEQKVGVAIDKLEFK